MVNDTAGKADLESVSHDLANLIEKSTCFQSLKVCASTKVLPFMQNQFNFEDGEIICGQSWWESISCHKIRNNLYYATKVAIKYSTNPNNAMRNKLGLWSNKTLKKRFIFCYHNHRRCYDRVERVIGERDKRLFAPVLPMT